MYMYTSIIGAESARPQAPPRLRLREAALACLAPAPDSGVVLIRFASGRTGPSLLLHATNGGSVETSAGKKCFGTPFTTTPLSMLRCVGRNRASRPPLLELVFRSADYYYYHYHYDH